MQGAVDERKTLAAINILHYYYAGGCRGEEDIGAKFDRMFSLWYTY